MSYQHWTAVTAGVTVGVWAPWGTPASTALLLGRTPNGWQAATASRLPRELTSRGVWCVTVDVPNWGNSTDLSRIDTAVAHAAAQGRDTTHLNVYAQGRGGIAAVNWSVRHIDQVAALALVSPVVDLEEHYARVPADQASIDAAFGGSLAAVASTWNPVAGDMRAWGRRVLDGLRDRVAMWWSDDDSDTPASVHTDLASFYRAETGSVAAVDPTTAEAASIAGRAAELAAGWSRQVSVLQQRWNGKRRDNASVTDWGGSDGNKRIPLPDGRAVWLQNDYRTGTIDGDESRSGGGITNNCGVVEATDGTLGATLHFEGASGPWLRPSDHPTGVYWTVGGIVEGASLQVLALHLTGGLPVDGVHVVTVDAVTLAQQSVTVRSYAGYNWAHTWQGADHTYITGSAPGAPFLSGRTAMARAPIGSFTGPWEFWDGDRWTAVEDDAAFLRDVGGDDLPLGAGGMVKVPGGPWLIASIESAFGDTVHVFRSDWGPYRPDAWEHYVDHRAEPYADMVVDGSTVLTYGGGNWFVDQSDLGELVMSHNINHPAGGTFDSGLYQAQFFAIPRP